MALARFTSGVRPRDTGKMGVRVPRRSTTSALPAIERRRSPIQGWGVFALEPIAKNKRIVTYNGEKIANKESLKRESRYLRNGHIWCFKLNRRYVRDAAVGGNVARFINHACAPNCYTRVIGETIWIIAARTIHTGEELTYDYCTDGVGSIQCRCRPGCTTMI